MPPNTRQARRLQQLDSLLLQLDDNILVKILAFTARTCDLARVACTSRRFSCDPQASYHDYAWNSRLRDL